MIRTRGHLLSWVLLLAFAGGCSGELGGNPQGPAAAQPDGGVIQEAEPPQVPAEIGTAPDPQDYVPEAIEVPDSFPPFQEQAHAVEYVQTMADIHVAVTKSRQRHEAPPQVTAVSGSMSCPTVKGQTGVMRQVGDTAKNTRAGKAMVIASCFKGKKRSIFFAPYKLYQIRQTKNVHVLEDTIRTAMIDYLAGVTHDKAGHVDRLITACSAGRMIGGLRDGNYIGSQRANTLMVKPNDQSEFAKVYRNARDTGSCAPGLFGSKG